MFLSSTLPSSPHRLLELLWSLIFPLPQPSAPGGSPQSPTSSLVLQSGTFVSVLRQYMPKNSSLATVSEVRYSCRDLADLILIAPACQQGCPDACAMYGHKHPLMSLYHANSACHSHCGDLQGRCVLNEIPTLNPPSGPCLSLLSSLPVIPHRLHYTCPCHLPLPALHASLPQPGYHQ